MASATNGVARLQSVPERSFGLRLREARTIKRDTQAMLGRQLDGVSQQLVGKWERGDSVPAEHHHVFLADYIGVRDAVELRELLDANPPELAPRRSSASRVSVERDAAEPRAYAADAALARVVHGLMDKSVQRDLTESELALLTLATAGLAHLPVPGVPPTHQNVTD